METGRVRVSWWSEFQVVLGCGFAPGFLGVFLELQPCYCTTLINATDFNSYSWQEETGRRAIFYSLVVMKVKTYEQFRAVFHFHFYHWYL